MLTLLTSLALSIALGLGLLAPLDSVGGPSGKATTTVATPAPADSVGGPSGLVQPLDSVGGPSGH